MSTSTRKYVGSMAKLAFCGATIAAIAWVFLTVHPEEKGVKQSEADLWDIVPTNRTNTQKFVSALESLGHEPPRAYDYNGNTVYFSERTVKDATMDEILHEYQNEFVWKGINEEPYTTFLGNKMLEGEEGWQENREDVRQRWLTSMSGQIVPMTKTDDFLEMGGGIIDGHPRTTEETKQQFQEMAERGKVPEFKDIFRGFRNIQANRTPNGKDAWVTAVWSEDDYDMKKHIPTDDPRTLSGVSADSTVPACPGCKRLNRFAGDSENAEEYVTNIFKSKQDYQSVTNFYKKAMEGRGWRETDSSDLTRRALQYTEYRNRLDSVFQFTKDGQLITVAITPEENGSLVTTFSGENLPTYEP